MKLSRRLKKRMKQNDCMLFTLKNGRVRPELWSWKAFGLGQNTPRLKKLLKRWGAQQQKGPIRIGLDFVGDAKVSTVFLTTNHNLSDYRGEGGPILFETMIFGGPKDDYQYRYRTLRQAQKGHRRTVAAMKELLLQGDQYGTGGMVEKDM